MTIQRQYSLPNCTLILEGLADPTQASSLNEARRPMTLLVNAEFRLLGQSQPLSGGREFIDSLVKSVSRYAQEFLSGIGFPSPDKGGLVHLKRVNEQLHHLEVYANNTAAQPIQKIELTTVQLFDLVEAIDQLLADSQILPDLTLQLAPVPRRYAPTHRPLAQQAVPAAIGVSGLALAATALFLLPIPELQRPKESTPKSPESGSVQSSPSPSASPPSSATPASPAAETPSPSPSPSPQPSETASPQSSLPPASAPGGVNRPTAVLTANAAEKADSATMEASLTAAPNITEPTQLSNLGKKLYDQIDQSWKTEPNFAENISFRVSVSREGVILGYKPTTDFSRINSGKTPLLNLVRVPPPNAVPGREPIAQFKVVFRPNGVLEVSPWHGFSPSPVAAAPGKAKEITDTNQLETLVPKVRDQIDQNWRNRPNFDQDLIYQVKVNPEGQVLAYEATNPSASSHLQETPLPTLAKTAEGADTKSVAQEQVAVLKVVFKPTGIVQVSPWRGY